MFEYIRDQLATLGCHDVESNTFVSDLAPVAYPYATTLSLELLPTVVPKTNTPVPASVAASSLSSTCTRNDDQYWARDCYKLIDQVSRTPTVKLPRPEKSLPVGNVSLLPKSGGVPGAPTA
jgi:hypothetical protein